MNVQDVIVLTYREVAILSAGILSSWVAVWLWATPDNDERCTICHTLALVMAFAIGLMLGWYAGNWYVL